MSFNNGDVVRIGKGKVEYTVRFDGESLNLIGEKSSRKNVDPDTLTLVHSDWIQDADVAEDTTDDVPALPEKLTDDEIQAIAAHVENPNGDVEIMAPWEIELLHGNVNPARPFLLTVDGVTSDHKSYGAACDALIIATRRGIQTYAVIDHAGQRKATRTAA